MYSYDNARPLVKIDNVVFGFDGVGLNVLLLQSINQDTKSAWSLPEGILDLNESIDDNAIRILREQTAIEDAYIEQFGVTESSALAGGDDHVLSIGFFVLVQRNELRTLTSGEGRRIAWFPLEEIPENITAGHADLIESARQMLRDRSHIEPIVFDMLDYKFSISELQRLIEVINGADYDRRNFYRKVIATGLLQQEGMAHIRAAHRPPQLFSFRRDLYDQMLEREPAMEFPFLF